MYSAIPRPHRRRALLVAIAIVSLVSACSADDPTTTKETTVTTTKTADTANTAHTVDHGRAVRAELVEVAGTRLAVEIRDGGSPLLLIHGGGEDLSMLAAQADDLAAAGYTVITYDRRGTGGSGRQDWPGSGADQHADDAAALLDQLDLAPAVVVGVSSGAVIALDLAARYPEHVTRTIAWEPPAAGVLAEGQAFTDEIMAPVDAYLGEHPTDFVGAQAILLSAIVGFPVAPDNPAFAATRANAEPMVRDEPVITLKQFGPADFDGTNVDIAVGSAPNFLIAAATTQLAEWTGRPTITVTGDHEVYLADPSVLTGIVTSGSDS